MTLLSTFRRRMAVLLGAAIVIAGVRASGQIPSTPFTPATRPVDWTRFTVAEQCDAAGARVNTKDAVWRSTRRDTLGFDPSDTLPTATRDVIRRCLTHIDASKVGEQSAGSLLSASLMMSDDSMAKVAIARTRRIMDSLLHLPPDTVLQRRARVLSEMVIGTVLSSHPLRWAMAKHWVAECDTIYPNWDLRGRIYPRYQLILGASSAGDQPLALATAQHTMDLLVHPPPNVPPDQSQYIPGMITGLTAMISDLKSLALPPREAYQHFADTGFQSFPSPLLGKMAPEVSADYWFNADSTTPKPRRGRISVISFADQAPADEQDYALFRRLHHAFPQVDFILMAKTHGYLRSKVTDSAAAEAAELNDFFHNVVKLPGTVAVSVTPFTRLPAPDGRVLEGLTPNEKTFGLTGALIVNQDGKVVYHNALMGRGYERLMAAMIAILVDGGPHTDVVAPQHGGQ